jgi:RNA polymerase-binding transcription factor DksA
MDATHTRELLMTLEQELHRLAARLRNHGPAGEPDPGSAGLADGDRGTDLFDQVQATESRESHFASRDRIVERLHRVSAALDRAREGSYGECTECRRPIPLARLRALPEATTCVGCQERLERAGQRAARLTAPGVVGEIEPATGSGVLRRADAADFRTSSEILETLRESVLPAAPPDAPVASPPPRPRARFAVRRGTAARDGDARSAPGARRPTPGTVHAARAALAGGRA